MLRALKSCPDPGAWHTKGKSEDQEELDSVLFKGSSRVSGSLRDEKSHQLENAATALPQTEVVIELSKRDQAHNGATDPEAPGLQGMRVQFSLVVPETVWKLLRGLVATRHDRGGLGISAGGWFLTLAVSKQRVGLCLPTPYDL
ncbi:hypothetical protein U0070_006794 [Myodes glareolus]|uniref:Uncharacterized protein n=1 Tax=Myodes glareolus TaxID=447135 RepID=A0AAW0HFA8_MYOGA